MSRRNICSEAANATTSGTPEEIWHYIYGTDYYGNLPQDKSQEHEGKSFMPCPYSTFSTPTRTRISLGLASYDPLPTQNSHVDINGKEYYLTTKNRGHRWGFECTYDACPYYTTNGQRYFYV